MRNQICTGNIRIPSCYGNKFHSFVFSSSKTKRRTGWAGLGWAGLADLLASCSSTSYPTPSKVVLRTFVGVSAASCVTHISVLSQDARKSPTSFAGVISAVSCVHPQSGSVIHSFYSMTPKNPPMKDQLCYCHCHVLHGTVLSQDDIFFKTPIKEPFLVSVFCPVPHPHCFAAGR